MVLSKQEDRRTQVQHIWGPEQVGHRWEEWSPSQDDQSTAYRNSHRLMQVINWILLRPCWKHWPLIFIYSFSSFLSLPLITCFSLLLPFHLVFFLLHCSSPFLSKGERRYLDSGSIIDDDLWLLKLLAPDLELFKVWQSGTPCVLINGAVPIRQRQPM